MEKEIYQNYNLRLPEDLYAWVKGYAEDEQRSMNSQIILAIQQLRDQAENPPPDVVPAGDMPLQMLSAGMTEGELYARLHKWAGLAMEQIIGFDLALGHDAEAPRGGTDLDALIALKLGQVGGHLASLQYLTGKRLGGA